MQQREVIICRKCGKKDCQLEELFEEVELSMEEYGQRYPLTFQDNFYSSERTARRFLITCQDCGEQYEFTERLEPLPHVKMPLFQGE